MFDSGVGGLTVVRELRRVLPHEDIYYLGDTARVPYGTKSPSTVTRFACEDALFLEQQKVKALVVACNTCSAWALPVMEKRFSVPVFGVVAPGARHALAVSRNKRIGIIGTTATIRSRAYSNAILEISGAAKIFARATPLLAPLVEEGWLGHQVTRMALAEYLKPLLRGKIDTLILGCTHYPLLKKDIAAVVGKNVRLVDSAASCAAEVAQELGRLNLLARGRRRQGIIQPFVTDETETFNALVKRFLGGGTEPASKVELAGL